MKRRAFWCWDELWFAAKAKARSNGEDLAHVIRRLLTAYVSED